MAYRHSNEKRIIGLARKHWACPVCKAEPGASCVSWRGAGYGEWFVHTARRRDLDDLFIAGVTVGSRRPRLTANGPVRRSA